ncbi:(d)CMP kinase [Brevibacillus humidisoli]|uniref:(d)CMP kinase n=1 Tax=Brevibacillus humidisoli TaxID=2895522 RepID=UPI001E51D47A|nr:(d)CMP kinase [Brevibacillus humidisoli]UFJ42806.1 (d)CMP kinase [Brevibacillus humidisoli]
MNIAIDGPAGAGKSTVAQMVAERLGHVYIDTGAMYRALAWAVDHHGIPVEDEAAVATLLGESTIALKRTEQGQIVLWNDQDITTEIRTPRVSQYASIVASYPLVREQMLHLQRAMASDGNVVMDGRDIGTHVLPDADVKIFLTASIEERAGRRMAELQQKGISADLESLKQEIAERDKRDSERKAAPLRQAEDAHLIDTTGLGLSQVVDRVMQICKQTGEQDS